MLSIVVVPSASRAATKREAPPRRSLATTSVPFNFVLPLIIA